jgi:Uma2 family endonuclease
MRSAAILTNPELPGLAAEVVDGYLHAPSTMVAEVIDGALSLLPRPRRQHAHAAGRLLGALGPYSNPRGDDPGGWLILPEPELHLGPRPDIVVPDLCGWRRERIPDDFLADDAPAHVELAPDWVCEVLSPRTEANDRAGKMRINRRERVGHVWLLSPSERTLEVYRLLGELYVLVEVFEGGAEVRAEPFAETALMLSAFWSL